MTTNLFTGDQVKLTAEEPENMSKAFARWSRDSEYHRMLNFSPGVLWSDKKWKEWLEKDLEKDSQDEFFFAIHTTADDRLIGFIGLMSPDWNQRDAWIVIGIGDRNDWGKGYGTDAMRLLLKYAFTELNLFRVTLGLFDYNRRAYRSYEKVGFVLEGRQRNIVNREGRRWDVLVMGILKSEWEQRSG